MLNGIRSRLTYANVIATAALFLALGGGAYALSGIPDGGGVYHGCVDPKAGGLRVVKAASSCRKTKTVQRGARRVRIPGESAIAWNQQGPLGLQGLRGLQGLQGLQGQKGDTGGPGISGWQLVLGYSAEDSNSFHEASASCPAGKKAIGAGGQIFVGPADAVALGAVIIFLDGSGARADGREVVPTSSNWSVNVEVICANVAP